MVALFPLWFSCEKTWGQLHGVFLRCVFLLKLWWVKFNLLRFFQNFFNQVEYIFLVEGIEWNWSSIDQQHQSLGDRSTCFFHVLDMLGILKIVVELKESNMIEIRCLNYQLCHLSPHVVTYLTPKNANNKNIHHFCGFSPMATYQLVTARLFLYKPHTIVVDNGNIWGWIPFNETFQVILVRGDVCKLKISLRAWQGRNPRKFLVTKRWGDVHDYLFVSSVLISHSHLNLEPGTFEDFELWYNHFGKPGGWHAASDIFNKWCDETFGPNHDDSNGRLDDVKPDQNIGNLSLIAGKQVPHEKENMHSTLHQTKHRPFLRDCQWLKFVSNLWVFSDVSQDNQWIGDSRHHG